MKKTLSLLFLPGLLLFTGCSKPNSVKNCDDHYKKIMKKRWMPLSSCSEEFKHYLGKGSYQSKIIYYTSISCVACNVVPPQVGVTCAGDSIKINNWKDVKDTKIVASCRDL